MLDAVIGRSPLTKSAVLGLLLLTLCGCQGPRYVNGRKVIGTRWVDGRVVSVLAPNEEDQAAIKKVLKDSETAAREVTFVPSEK